MTDIQRRLGQSLIQHGKSSDRIYLMELNESDMPGLIDKLDELAKLHSYSKIFAKVPGRWSKNFRSAGYRSEAIVPGLFDGRDEGHFMGRFLSPSREHSSSTAEVQEVIRIALKKGEPSPSQRELPEDLSCRKCLPEDVEDMAKLYGQVFESYPFPINDPEFLRSSMHDNVVYFGVWSEDSLVGLASAEQYQRSKSAEMTDFATKPDFRGKGLAQHLLGVVEEYAASVGHQTAFTIARSISIGMNVTFARGGYTFAGTLINNTQIGGKIESMNVWYKNLSSPPST